MPSAARIEGKSEARAPIAATSMRNGSSAAVRQSAKRPFSVMYAEIAKNASTTSDFRLPPPRRISVLLPQPEPSVMPKPNRKPPTASDSQAIRLPV
jgi:hypothetical protein